MRASTLLAAVLLALASVSAKAIEFRRVADPPGGSVESAAANSNGILARCFDGSFYYRPDGAGWRLVTSIHPEWDGAVYNYGVSEDEFIYAGNLYYELDRTTAQTVRRIDLASGDDIERSTCDSLWDYELCGIGTVIQSGPSIFVIHPTFSSALTRLIDGAWSGVIPPLYRWIDDDVSCSWDCKEGAPVSAAAQLNEQTFAYGDIRQYLGNPIGDFVRTENGTWTDANMSHDGPVIALFNYEGTIVAGGTFTSLDGQATPAAAKWTGSTWTALIPELAGKSASVSAFATHQGYLLFNARMTVANRMIHQLWATDGHMAQLLDEEAPPGEVVATNSRLYIVGIGGLYRSVGTIVPTSARSWADLKKLFEPSKQALGQ